MEKTCSECGVVFVPTNPKWKTRCADCLRAYYRNWQRNRLVVGKEWRPSLEQAKAKYERERQRMSLGAKQRRAANMARYRDTPEYRLKFEARAKVTNSLKVGTLSRLPCEVCGVLKAQAHHDDYSKPLDVRWLCRDHHSAFHKEQRSLKRKGLAHAELR